MTALSLAHDEVAAELIAWRNRALHGILDVAPRAARRRSASRSTSPRVGRCFTATTSPPSSGPSSPALRFYADWHAAPARAIPQQDVLRARASRRSDAGPSPPGARSPARFDTPTPSPAFCWARSGRASPTREEAYGPLWGFYLPMRDPAFERTMAEGLADIHVHLEACDPIPLLWLRRCHERRRGVAPEAVLGFDARLSRTRSVRPAAPGDATARNWNRRPTGGGT